MPILDPSHDGMHPVEGDSAWSESYYFNAYEGETGNGIAEYLHQFDEQGRPLARIE